MIDFHTHLLPCIDDGANSAETAKNMLERSKEQGVTTALLTSHYYGTRISPTQFLEARSKAFEELKKVAPKGISFVLAAEVYFTGDTLPSFADITQLKIENTDYVLLELPFIREWRNDLLERIKEFQSETGLIPILAHAERYESFEKSPKLLWEFVKAGCLLQIDADAFLDKRKRSFVFALLNHGLVHCLGSDMHDEGERPQCLAKAKFEIEEAGYGEAFEKMQENMRLILQNKILQTEHTPIKRFFGKYF